MASALDLGQIVQLPNGVHRVRTLLMHHGDTLLPKLNGKQVIHEYLQESIGKYLGGQETIVSLKERKITPYSGLLGLIQKLFLKLFGQAIEEGYLVRKKKISQCSAQDFEKLLADEGMYKRLLFCCLSALKKNLPRYTLRVDNKVYTSHHALHEYLMETFPDDKVQVFKMLLFTFETINAITFQNADKKWGGFSNAVSMQPQFRRSTVELNTKTQQVVHKTDYTLRRREGDEAPNEYIAPFRLSHEVDLKTESVRSRVIYNAKLRISMK